MSVAYSLWERSIFSKFLDPKNDVAFKRIFGTERNKNILIRFLNDMLVFKEGYPIQDVTFLKPNQDPEIAFQKTSIVDVLCQDTHGNTYVVEMQVVKEKGFEKRAQYYAAKTYVQQMHAGGKYENLKEVIFLAIVNFVLFPEKAAYKSDHIILDKNTLEHDLKDFSFTFLELGKFNKTHHEASSMIDKWAYFFKHAEEISAEDTDTRTETDLVIRQAYLEVDRYFWTPEEQLSYDQKMKYEMVNQATLEYQLEEKWEQGRDEAKIEMAKSLLAKNYLPLDKISEVTGIPQLELERLIPTSPPHLKVVSNANLKENK